MAGRWRVVLVAAVAAAAVPAWAWAAGPTTTRPPPLGGAPPPGSSSLPPVAATSTVPGAVSDPPAVHQEATAAAVALGRVAAGLQAAGSLTSTDDGQLSTAVAPLDPSAGTPRATVVDGVRGADGQLVSLVAQLGDAGVPLSSSVAQAAAALPAADYTAATAGDPVSWSAETALFALDDLVGRDGRAPPPPRPAPDPAALAAALAQAAAVLPTSTAPTSTSTATTGSDTGAAASSSRRPAGGSWWWLPVLVAVALVAAGAALTVARRRRPPVAAAPRAPTEVGAGPVDGVGELLEVSRRLALVTSPEEVYAAIAREVTGLVHAASAALAVRGEHGLVVGHETRPGLLIPEFLSAGAVGRVFDTGQPTLQVSASEPAIRSLPVAMVAVPLVVSGQVSAVLVVVRSAAEPFGSAERDLLLALAPVAAAAILAAERAFAARLDSLVDPLTQVGNRRRLDGELPACLARPGALPVAVAMVDLDHFKAVNDGHGHPAGDALLRAVAAVLRATVRPGDGVYRYGGEEFVLVMPATAAAEAAQVAERVRAAVAAQPFEVAPGVRLAASASLGVAAGGEGGAEGLLAAADRALYVAKQQGRNQVVVDGGAVGAAGR